MVTALERDQYRLISGDLLACRFNGNRESVGLLALFTNSLRVDPIFPDKLIRLRVNRSQVLPDLLRWFSRSTLFRSRVAAFVTTTVGNWGVSATNLKRVFVPLPPIDEQPRIVAKVDELMAVCDELEAALATAQMARVRLLEALLHDALEGAALPNPVGTVTGRLTRPNVWLSPAH